MLKNRVNGCHGNHAFFHSAIEFIFEDKNSLHFWGPNERFGTHEKLSWGGCKVGQISSRGIERKRNSDVNQGQLLRQRFAKNDGNNPKLELVNVDVHTKFGQILSIRFQDIEWKRKFDVNQGP